MSTAISNKWKELHNPQIDAMKVRACESGLGGVASLRRGLVEDFASLSKALTDYILRLLRLQKIE